MKNLVRINVFNVGENFNLVFAKYSRYFVRHKKLLKFGEDNLRKFTIRC